MRRIVDKRLSRTPPRMGGDFLQKFPSTQGGSDCLGMFFSSACGGLVRRG